jgi:hypothetical protein
MSYPMVYRVMKRWPSKLNPDKLHTMAIALVDDRHEADRLCITLSRHYGEDWAPFSGIEFYTEEVGYGHNTYWRD